MRPVLKLLFRRGFRFGAASGRPAAPTNLILSTAGADLQDVALSWTINSGNATHQRIERSYNNVDWTALEETFDKDTDTYTDTTVDVDEVTIYYRVRAENASGESPWEESSMSGLLLGLMAFWSLDEVSGNRSDSVGSNTLTDNNTVTSASGLLGNAAQFLRTNSEYLSVASLGFDLTDFTIATWYYTDSASGYLGMLRMEDGVDGLYLAFRRQDNQALDFRTTGGNSGLGSDVTATWANLTIRNNGATGTVTSNHNGGASQSYVASPALNFTAPSFSIGNEAWGGSTFWTGLFDNTGIWNRELSDAQHSVWENSGAGLAYPFN